MEVDDWSKRLDALLLPSPELNPNGDRVFLVHGHNEGLSHLSKLLSQTSASPTMVATEAHRWTETTLLR